MSLHFSVEDNIIIFSFENGKSNAISTEILESLNEAIKRVNTEEGLKGLIMIGSGRFFSSGFELETFTNFQHSEEVFKWFEFQEEVMYNLFTCKKPVVAAVNGHATAAGMIVSMAADYRIAVNNPKIKMGMTEIKIGLSLTPAEGEIMRFGLVHDKNFRDVIFGGELMTPAQAVEKGIFDELAGDETELLKKAKAKICSLIDTPGRPFMLLKYLEKKHTADHIRTSGTWYDWNAFANAFLNESVRATLNRVKQSMA